MIFLDPFVKMTPPKPLTAHQLSQRQKEIAKGKSHADYIAYSARRPANYASTPLPVTPPTDAPVSKKEFYRRVLAWKHGYHDWYRDATTKSEPTKPKPKTPTPPKKTYAAAAKSTKKTAK